MHTEFKALGYYGLPDRPRKGPDACMNRGGAERGLAKGCYFLFSMSDWDFTIVSSAGKV